MPFSEEMKKLADNIFIRDSGPIRQRFGAELQRVIRASAARQISPAGAVQNQLDVQEEELRELADARLNSYTAVLKQAKQQIRHEDIDFIVRGIDEIASVRIGSIISELELQIRRTNWPIDLTWVKASLERTRSSVVATISRNLEIDRQMAALAATAAGTTQFAFIVMSFNSTLDFLYRDALVPAVTDSGLQPYRVDREEFEGTISEEILKKIRNSRLVVADLTDERPNCYFELGYALALAKPIVLAARKDHDPRRELRNPDDPKVHFDLDSHKITYWARERMDELRQELAARMKKHLERLP
jgi:hypothetical protein